MKSFPTSVGGLLLSAVGVAAAACNADNCARAVTGTFRQLTASHYGDCQSYMACTVFPATTTLTSIVTVTPGLVVSTVTAGPFPEKFKRDSTPQPPITSCPTAVPSYASACSGSVRYSSACSCAGVTRSVTTATTPTVITSVTTTLPTEVSIATIQPPAPSLCNNAGLQWAYFRDFADDNTQEQEESYDPTTHKTDIPQLSGSTTYLHFSSYEGSVYGQPADNIYFALEHRGYLFAPETGNYTFSVYNVDNDWYMWIGSQAYSGWDKQNAKQITLYDTTTHNYGTNTYKMSLVAGTYYPIRMVFDQGSGGGSFDYHIDAPSGYELIGPNPNTAKGNPFIVQYSCDGVLAPAYPPFGQET